ncbi:MAG TPA: SsgA family sporulation/cell division regulator [Mycobacteriales bacterium]|nr:SsgA family sporulation/cell division regulator [Mycobacteriales bacterium]
MTMPRPTMVTNEVLLRLVVPGSSSLPVRAELRYDVTDPYAVQVCFHTGSDGDTVEWTFARQLLSDGVSTPAGEGDVQIWPSLGQSAGPLLLSLSSPSGRALFEVPMADVVQFLGQSFAAVPAGAETAHFDLDAELAMLLWVEPET